MANIAFSDYLMFQEQALSRNVQKFDVSCKQFEDKLNVTHEIIQNNFDEFKKVAERNACGMKENCKQVLLEMIQLFKMREILRYFQ
jgi:hypothetical protein